jgi:hypothetical protein
MNKLSEKAMQLAVDFAIPKTWLNDLARAEDIAAQIDAHTAEALSEYKRVLDECEKRLEEIQTLIHYAPSHGEVNGIIMATHNAKTAIAKLRKE